MPPVTTRDDCYTVCCICALSVVKLKYALLHNNTDRTSDRIISRIEHQQYNTTLAD
jgi:hypothetical protein